jgi:glutamate carboxypeptidase
MRALSSVEQAAVERCPDAPMLDQVRAWAAINSGSRNLEGLGTIAALLADQFSALPGALALEEAAPVEAMDSDGRLVGIDHGRNLHLKVRPEAPVQVLLTGHMDTVFGAGHPFQSLAWIDEARVLGGPGVADMKGGIAVMLAALKAVEASPPLAERLGYEVVINSDEEVGSPGSAALIARAAAGKRAALTYEPSALPDGTLAGARPGSGNFSLLVEGRSAHAGRNPEDGRNALVAAAELALRLDSVRRPGLSVNPARIDGGGPNNVVPDRAVLRVNMRPLTPDDEAEARGRLDAIAAEVAAARDVRVTVHGGFGRPPKPLTPEAERLFALVARCGRDLGREPGWRASGGVCDGNNIAARGVPVVDTMGVRGGSIHSAEEYLIVESLAERAALSALTLLRLALGEEL